MSAEFGLFFNSRSSLVDTAGKLAGLTHIDLRASGAGFEASFLGQEFWLSSNELVNDAGCEFEAYENILEVKTWSSQSQFREIQLETSLLLLFILLLGRVTEEVLLVFGVQLPLGIYSLEDGEIIERGTGLRVDFAVQLRHLHERLGATWRK